MAIKNLIQQKQSQGGWFVSTISEKVQNSFAVRLKLLREREKMTQSDLAAKLEVSRGSISYYEKMERVPDIIFLTKVADYFGVSTEWLLGFSEDLTPPIDRIHGDFIAQEVTGLSFRSVTKLNLDKEIDSNEYIDGLNKLIESEHLPNFAGLIMAYCNAPNSDFIIDLCDMTTGGIDDETIETKSLLRALIINCLFKILDKGE